MQGVTLSMELRKARSQLRLTQLQLAELADVSVSTVSNCERGESVSLITAYALLDALNRKRLERGMLALTIDDLDWNVR